MLFETEAVVEVVYNLKNRIKPFVDPELVEILLAMKNAGMSDESFREAAQELLENYLLDQRPPEPRLRKNGKE